MRTFVKFVVATLVGGMVATGAFAQTDDMVVVGSTTVFVPNGFDDNDEVVAVLDGMLPDGCHRLSHNEYKFDPQTGIFEVFQYARRFDVPCLPALVPYYTEVRLGMLPFGDYEIKAKGAMENLHVKEAASAGPDDFLYAPVDQAMVEKAPDGKILGTLQGRFTNSCMKMVEVRVIDSGKTKEILPVMEMTDDPDVLCAAVELPFTETIELPADAEGRYLLHVRSLNGKSVNHVYSVR